MGVQKNDTGFISLVLWLHVSPVEHSIWRGLSGGKVSVILEKTHSFIQVTGSRLLELEQERLQMQEERELLSRQQDAMREHAGPRELRTYLSFSSAKKKRGLFLVEQPTGSPHF